MSVREVTVSCITLKIDPFIHEGDVFATLRTDDSMAGIVHVFC